MKKLNSKNVKNNKSTNEGKKWRIGEYIRQLSVVILGIVITFVGSDIINQRSKQKEVTAVMQLVKAELKINREKLLDVKNASAMEIRICEMLVAQKYKYENIPDDTLVKYVRSLNSIRYFDYSDNSIEVLKNSSLMQHVSDKAFLLSLIETYESLNALSGTVSLFYDRHRNYWNLLSEEMSEAERDAMYKGIINNNEVKEFYRVLLSFKRTRDYMLNNCGFFGKNVFDLRYNHIEKSIRAIETKYE